MTNHPNRSREDEQTAIIDRALGIILKDHAKFQEADRDGRRNIRRNIGTTLSEMFNNHTVEQLVADWRNLR
jgi:hypothetical protein